MKAGSEDLIGFTLNIWLKRFPSDAVPFLLNHISGHELVRTPHYQPCCSPWGREELDMTEWLHFHFSLSCIGKGNGNPLQCSCLENPRDSGAWWVTVYGVAQSRTWLKRLSSSSSTYIYLYTYIYIRIFFHFFIYIQFYIFIFFCKFFSLIGYYQILIVVLCAIQRTLLAIYFIYSSMYMLISNS